MHWSNSQSRYVDALDVVKAGSPQHIHAEKEDVVQARLTYPRQQAVVLVGHLLNLLLFLRLRL